MPKQPLVARTDTRLECQRGGYHAPVQPLYLGEAFASAAGNHFVMFCCNDDAITFDNHYWQRGGNSLCVAGGPAPVIGAPTDPPHMAMPTAGGNAGIYADSSHHEGRWGHDAGDRAPKSASTSAAGDGKDVLEAANIRCVAHACSAGKEESSCGHGRHWLV